MTESLRYVQPVRVVGPHEAHFLGESLGMLPPAWTEIRTRPRLGSTLVPSCASFAGVKEQVSLLIICKGIEHKIF